MEKKRIIKTSSLFILLCVVAFCAEFYYANNTKNIILPEKSEIYTVTVTNGTNGNTTTILIKLTIHQYLRILQIANNY